MTLSSDAPRQLSLPEAERLEELEAVVARGRRVFVEVGAALLEIRDSRLYRQDYGTFEDYCRQRWDFSRFTAYDLIKTSEAALLVEEVQQPTREQARELAPLRSEPEVMREVYREAVETYGPEPTAQEIRATRLGVHFSSADETWETPADLFEQLDEEFGFVLDVCASEANTKCALYFDKEMDGLKQEWRGVCWMNSPYGDVIGDWVAKAHAAGNAGAIVVCLVPARTDTAWWWDHARHGEVRFLRGRLRFVGADSSAPFPSAVVIFGLPARVVWWER
ncbi:MAG TPA: DNA N-6-adenine-methyltransferase [Dehalococcoidia bacterium]